MNDTPGTDTPFASGAAPARRLTADLPGVGGVIKQRPEDFLVDEQPAYLPCGEGEHIYLLIEKRELSTMQMVDIVARHFNVPRDAVGYAGMKDKHAVTRQVVSVHTPGKDLSDFPELQHDRCGVLWADMHTNKLRVGHLRANRFSIRIRNVEITAVRTALAALQRMQREGVPNRFGAQRFGGSNVNHRIGRAILLGDAQGALDEMLGAGSDQPTGAFEESQRLYASGRYEEALRALPPMADPERRALSALARGATPGKALRALGSVQRRFLISAFQSAVFNRVLDERLGSGRFGALEEGDLAWRHDSGAVFEATGAELADPETQGRCERLEISPSGPLWGPKMKRASGQPGERELAALLATGVSPESIAAVEPRLGARRPLRVPLVDPDVEAGVDEHGSFIRCAFELPRGAFATAVMEEIMKTGEAADEDEEETT